MVGIKSNLIGYIELSHEMDIDDVTDIFIRINSTGAELSQADFAMSKIASNEIYGGNLTRKLIDYFCHLIHNPEDYEAIKDNDIDFANTDLFNKLEWVKKFQSDVYVPEYTDVLRVAFTSKFYRGRLSELVSLLSGRNFETREYYEEIAEESFNLLREGVIDFINETNFKRYLMILKSAGIINNSLIRSKSVLNFGYILFLYLRSYGENPAIIENVVRRWVVMSTLTSRYTSSPETAFDYDIKRLKERNIQDILNNIESGELSDAYWDTMLVTSLESSISTNPQYNVYLMAQVFFKDRGFLSEKIMIKDLLEQKGDKHHVFPKKYLQKKGISSSAKYNQLANYAYTQTEINIKINHRSPKEYFDEIIKQCNGNDPVYGGIKTIEDLEKNLIENSIPIEILNMEFDDFESFLKKRRVLMAEKIKRYYKELI